MAAGRNVLNFNVKCFQDNGSFLHPAKKADAHQLSKINKKNSPKTSLKKNRKTDGKRMQKKKKKLPARIVLHIAVTTHMRQMSFVGKINHLANVVFGWRINIACCCPSMGTRILLTSLVDLVKGCVRTKWLT